MPRLLSTTIPRSIPPPRSAVSPLATSSSNGQVELTLHSLVLAETRQEFLEILLIPLATSLIIPMTFSELYLTMCYTLVSRLLYLLSISESSSTHNLPSLS